MFVRKVTPGISEEDAAFHVWIWLIKNNDNSKSFQNHSRVYLRINF